MANPYDVYQKYKPKEYWRKESPSVKSGIYKTQADAQKLANVLTKQYMGKNVRVADDNGQYRVYGDFNSRGQAAKVGNRLQQRDITSTLHVAKPTFYQEGAEKAKAQLDPVYQQAVKGVRAERYQNQLNAGQVAASRGLSHSGLAADQQNKVNIAAQNSIANIQGDKAAKIAELAQSYSNQEQNRTERQEQEAYSRYQQAKDQQWREHTFNNMSESDRRQLEWAKTQYGEDAAWRMYDQQYQGNLQSSMNQAELDFYKNAGLADFLP